jgi:hypothetical protein
MKRIFFFALLLTCFLPATAPADCIRGNCVDGEGVMSFGDGRLYEGQFVNGLFNGHGSYTLSERIRYVGNFRDGEFHGQGTYLFDGVLEYAGQFVENVPQGQGTMHLADGRNFIGTFKNGGVNGQGVLTLPDGRMYAGTFDNAVLAGPISPAMLADSQFLGVSGADSVLVKTTPAAAETEGLGYTPVAPVAQ